MDSPSGRTSGNYDPFGAAPLLAPLFPPARHGLRRETSPAATTTSSPSAGAADVGGLATRALENAGAMHSRMIVILQRKQHVDREDGFERWRHHLGALFSGRGYQSLREIGTQLAQTPAEGARDRRSSRRGIRRGW